VGAVVVVIVLPFSQLLVEEVDVVADAVLVEQLIELLVVDAVRALDLAVQARRPRTDVDVLDVELLQVPARLFQSDQTDSVVDPAGPKYPH
jgi:hypothetical protein